jgi:ribonuclease D
MHKVRRRRQMAVVRELWTARDKVAQKRDVSPGKVLSDAAIVEAALQLPSDVRALAGLPGFGHRMGRKQLDQWQAAVDRAKELDESQLPQQSQTPNGPPPPRSWADKDPEAAARLSAARAAVTARAEELRMPQENLLTPDTVRRVCWQPPESRTEQEVVSALRALGAREWQIEQTAGLLTEALTASPEPQDAQN